MFRRAVAAGVTTRERYICGSLLALFGCFAYSRDIPSDS